MDRIAIVDPGANAEVGFQTGRRMNAMMTEIGQHLRRRLLRNFN